MRLCAPSLEPCARPGAADAQALDARLAPAAVATDGSEPFAERAELMPEGEALGASWGEAPCTHGSSETAAFPPVGPVPRVSARLPPPHRCVVNIHPLACLVQRHWRRARRRLLLTRLSLTLALLRWFRWVAGASALRPPRALSGALVVPQAFGHIRLGETFVSLVRVLNGSARHTANVGLRAELSAERGAACAARAGRALRLPGRVGPARARRARAGLQRLVLGRGRQRRAAPALGPGASKATHW